VDAHGSDGLHWLVATRHAHNGTRPLPRQPSARSERTGVLALAGVTIGFQRGTFTAAMGSSGSGKSTLLHCAAGLDKPTDGSVKLEGRELSGLSENELTKIRRERVGRASSRSRRGRMSVQRSST
jgi:ABC-type glutathione transport system ATPase component